MPNIMYVTLIGDVGSELNTHESQTAERMRFLN